jgi:hypothetical protein
MHQLRMRPLKLFWGWAKNTFSCPKLLVFSLFFAPNFFPPTYLPPTYLSPSYLHFPPPTYHIWFCAHSITELRSRWSESRIWEPLEREQNLGAIGARAEFGSSWSGSKAMTMLEAGPQIPLSKLRLSKLQSSKLRNASSRTQTGSLKVSSFP